ncbi:MAG: response regulator [Spirochaetaceae bacterium]|nr:response regulator [Spirochaetaceae bacterium]
MAEETLSSGVFFANAVHELRTPIQTIIGTLELFGDTELNEEQTEYIRQIKFSADILLSLVNDLLDFSKLRSGKFKIERIPVDPIEVTESTVDLISMEAHNRGLEIITDIDYNVPKSVWGDPTRIQQLLLNLVKNACKFTANGYICVKLSAIEDNKYLLFEVLDSGIGVPDDKKDLIFKDFTQADASTSRKFGGTGLGLSICRNLVELLGGQIGIKDNPDGGSIFWFKLPLEVCPDTPERKVPEAVVDIPKDIRILIVDDHKLARKSLKDKLASLGLTNVQSAVSGEEALSMLRSAAKEHNPFKIALIDMIMPVMDGWRVSAEINADHDINSTLLYLIVPEGKMGGEAKMKMLDWFNGYLYKPIKRHLLAKILNEGRADPLDLEVAKPEAQAAAEPPQPAPEKKSFPCKVLVSDDHPINQKLLKTFLEQMDVTVFSASNGNEAVARIKEHPEISLIFMDIQMPEKNGVEATEELRADGYKGIIIACTANSDESDFVTYRNAGMNDTLIKPFKRQNVRDTLDKWYTVINEDSEIAELEAIPDDEPAELEPIDDNKPDTLLTSIWDVNDMLDTVSNNFMLAEQLIEQFISQTRSSLITAKEALYMTNYTVLANIAHSLKGSSAAMSAGTLADAARKMEVAAKQSDPQKTGQYINEFSAAFTKFAFLADEQIALWKRNAR